MDANGLVVERENATIKYKGAKFENNELKSGETLVAGDKFTVEAVVGLNTVKSQEVTVVNTSTKYVADFTQYTVTANSTDDLIGALTGKVTVKADGKAVDTAKLGDVTAVELLSTDESVVGADGSITAPVKPNADATVVVLVNSIKINIDNVEKTIEFKTPVKLTVKVAAVAAE